MKILWFLRTMFLKIVEGLPPMALGESSLSLLFK
jgi:hypothetical protein